MDMKRLEEVYRKWDQKVPANIPPSKPRNRFNDDCQPHRRKRKGRTAALPSLDLVPELAHFKMCPPASTDLSTVSRPAIGRCCPKCAQMSREVFFHEDIQRRGMRNILKTPKAVRPGLLSRYFPHLDYALFRGVSHKYPLAKDMSEKVLENQRVQLAIHKSAMSESEGRPDPEAQYQEASNKHRRRAMYILGNMAASLSNSLIRITGWLLLKLLGLFLMGVQVHEGQLEMVQKAAESGVPVIIVPLHRSHLDYILLSFIFHLTGIRLPFVAAGDNLNIPIFGWCLRRLGAFFIKRKLDKEIGKKDWVYRSTLHTYMEEILRNNQNMEFFIEGGRSRSGKALAPKGGLLSCVVDAYRDDIISDAYIIPTSISYEKILDGSFSNEQMGMPKKRETFFRAVQGIWHVLSNGFGNVRVDFAQPFSLKEYLSASPMPTALNSDLSTVTPKRPKLQKAVSDHSIYGMDVVIEDQRQLIRGLGEHIVYDSVKINTVMSTNLVAFLLLTKFRQGVEMAQLVEAVDNLKRDVMLRGRDVGFTGETADVIKHTVALLGPDLVARHRARVQPDIVPPTAARPEAEVVREMIVPNTGLPHVFELSYYGAGLVSVFLMESIVASALLALCNEDLLVIDNARKRTIILSRDRLARKAEELCDMLQFEFTFVPPCGNISHAISEAIDQLVLSEVVIPQETAAPKKLSHGVRKMANWDSDDSDEEPSIVDLKIEVNTSQESLCRLYFLQSILAPYIEGYWLSACNLIRLLDCDVPEAHFSQVVNAYSKDRVAKGLAIYAESCAMDTLRNSWRLFNHWKAIDCYLDADKVRMVHLNEPFRSEEKLGVFIDRIEAFRM
ncbi:glycerol-3-phosphate acyltransferase 1, mitochondrial-like isoform X2 [Diadema setosum]